MREKWDHPIERFCGNCGMHLFGNPNENGLVKFHCFRCGMVCVAKKMSRRVIRVEEHAPPGQKVI